MLGSNSDFKLINKSWYKAWCKWKELLHWKYLILLFLALNLKKLLLYLTSASSLCQIVLFLAKKNPFKCLIWVFLGRNSKKLLYCYFTSALSNFSKQKISSKNKNPQILDQNCLNWVFWAGISMSFAISISTSISVSISLKLLHLKLYVANKKRNCWLILSLKLKQFFICEEILKIILRS